MRALVWRLLVVYLMSIAIAFAVGSCGGHSGRNVLLKENPGQLDSLNPGLTTLAIAEVDSYEAVDGVSTELQAELRDRLKAVLREKGVSKAHPPLGDENRINDLHIVQGNGYLSLVWSYRCIGDYDQNGEVNISDLTPLALFLGKKGEFADDSLESVVDGDGNGSINISDTTPIGVNFNTTIDSFHVYMSSNATDCPGEPDGPNGEGSVLAGDYPANIAIRVDGGRATVSFPIQNAKPGMYYWVRPAYGNTLGASSQSVQIQNTQAGWMMMGCNAQNTRLSTATGPVDEQLDWTFKTDGTIGGLAFSKPAFGSGGVVYAASGTDLHAYNADGTLSWRADIRHAGRQPAIGAGGTIFVSAGNQVYAFNPDGSVRWQHISPWDGYGPPTVNNGCVYIASAEGYLEALDSSGNMIWYKEIIADRIDDPLVIGPEGTILFISQNIDHYTLSCYRPSGSLAWEVPFGEAVYSRPTVTDDGRIVVTSRLGDIRAFDKDGQELWSDYIGNGVTAHLSHAVALDDGRIAVVAFSQEIYLYHSDGTLLKTTQISPYSIFQYNNEILGGSFFENGIVVCAGNYSGTNPMTYDLVACDVDGNIIWTMADCSLNIANLHVNPAGDVFIGCQGRYSSAACNWMKVDVSGETRWHIGGGGAIEYPPVVSPTGTIAFVCSDGWVYAVNPDGTEKWKYPLAEDYGFEEKSLAITEDDTVYLVHDGKLYSISNTGALNWTWPGPKIISYPILGLDGIIFVTTESGMYAIRPDSTTFWNVEHLSLEPPLIANNGQVMLFNVDVIKYVQTGELISTTSFDQYLHNPAITTGNEFVAGGLTGDNEHYRFYLSEDDELIDLGVQQHTNGIPAIAADGTIYLSYSDDAGEYELYCVDQASGTAEWTFEGGDGYISPPAIGADGTLYCASNTYPLISVDPGGTANWYSGIRTDEGFRGNAPVIGPDGTVYVTARNGKLYAFGTGN